MEEAEGGGEVLRRVDEGLWVVSAPQRFMGLRMGCRMTVVRLGDGGLLLHSPTPLGAALKASIDALGPVRHIVAPSSFHHLHAGASKAAWPEALLHGAPGLAAKRPDLTFDTELHARTAHPAWAGVLEQAEIEGAPALREVVFFHRESATLIATDLLQNFGHVAHAPTRWYLKAAGVHDRPGVSRLVRLGFQDKALARASLEHVLKWPFERLIVAHGEVVETGGAAVLRQAYGWLGVEAG